MTKVHAGYTLHATQAIPSAPDFVNVAQAQAKRGDDGEGSVCAFYSVEGLTPKAGESDQDAFERALKYALHRDFPITGDDGGYSLTAVPAGTTSGQLQNQFLGTGFADNTQLEDALVAAANAGDVVLTGSGSGNNTYADIAAVLDPKDGKIGYDMDSNFGSDD